MAELRRALLERDHAPAEVEPRLERLRARALPRRRRLRRALRAEPHGAPGAGAASASAQGLRQRGVDPGDDRSGPRRGAAARWTSARSSTAWPAATGAQHAAVEPARRLPRLWAFLLRRGFAPALVRRPPVRPLAALERRARRARAGGADEPRGPTAGDDVGTTSDRPTRSAAPSSATSRSAGHRVVKSSSARAAERPDAALRQRGDEPVQGRVPRAREARLHARRLVPEVRARRRQAQRPRERGRDRAPPHLLRDARQLLVRRLLQEGGDRLRLGVPDRRPRPGRRTG